MSNFKGTKGKWEIKHSETKDAFNICGTLVGDKYKIARISYLVTKSSMKLTEKDKTQAKYDAQLIAHAPEMLEMLEAKICYLDNGSLSFYEKYNYNAAELSTKIRKLIKKATEI